MVPCLEIMDGKYPSFNVLFGSIGKPYVLILPVVFLQAILNNSESDYPVVSKDSIGTPGLNEPLTLPDSFVRRLSSALETKSVVTWLIVRLAMPLLFSGMKTCSKDCI